MCEHPNTPPTVRRKATITKPYRPSHHLDLGRQTEPEAPPQPRRRINWAKWQLRRQKLMREAILGVAENELAEQTGMFMLGDEISKELTEGLARKATLTRSVEAGVAQAIAAQTCHFCSRWSVVNDGLPLCEQHSGY